MLRLKNRKIVTAGSSVLVKTQHAVSQPNPLYLTLNYPLINFDNNVLPFFENRAYNLPG